MKVGFFDLAYLYCFIVLALVRLHGVWWARRQQPGKVKPRPKMEPETILALLQSLGLFILPFIYLFSTWLDWANYRQVDILAYLGLASYLLGIWMLWQTHRILGSNWSDQLQIQEDQTLVTNGIYARIRHPMYTAHLLAALGQCLMLANWIAGPSFLVLQLPFYAVRIPKEEGLLLQHFGEVYHNYMARTGRLLPKW